MKLLGIDTGGTFTDFVYYDGREIRVHKVLSSPDAPERAILQGIDEMSLNAQNLLVIHGSTVATNAVLEGKGGQKVVFTHKQKVEDSNWATVEVTEEAKNKVTLRTANGSFQN